MNKILNAAKEKFNILKKNAKLRYILISVFALLLIFSVTLAWYINKVGLWGMEFNTGNIEFNTYVYSEDGSRLVGPVSSAEEDQSKYMNAPLLTIDNAQVGSTGVAYIVVESTGSLGIDYRIAFDITGRTDKSTAYLGGYKYNITKVTDKVTFNGGDTLDVTRCPRPEKINNEIVTIDRNAVNGTIKNKNDFDVYRVDYTLVHKNEEYTGNSIHIYFNIFATQIGGDFEDTAERGYTYYCATREDLDRARVEAYPGDSIKLTADIVYYGDLVFNKPVSLETNDHTLTVNGNLMYDYVLGNSLKLDAGGLGTIIVQCTKEGVGGNFQIKAPIGDVTLIGANSPNGDFIIEKNITIDATNSFGSAGVSFNEVRIVDLKNSRKTIYLDSNTRATVSFGTTIGLLQSVVKASNIEIINNGVIGEINLSNMTLLPQTNSPQIYILNNNDIDSPIMLPSWSVKFVEDASGKCSGNTKIIQSYSGSFTEVSGNCDFDNTDILVERKDFLVEQIEEGNDSRLKIYYQDVGDETTTIQSILTNYLQHEATTGCAMYDILELEIISIGNKAVTTADIAFMNSNEMLALRQLDMQRANVCDTATGTYHKLPNYAFSSVSKYTELVLPQNLVEIGDNAFTKSNIANIITVPSGVTVFGENWFNGGKYVGFAASVPVAAAATGLTNVSAIFVDEAYISSYISVYSQYKTLIYPTSTLDETKEHFVRNTMADEWEITYYISGEDAVIGQNITMDGKLLKITSIYDNAYRHNYTGSVVRFADTVEKLGANNFYNKKSITEVDLNKIKYLGAYAFYGCDILEKVTVSDVLETIETYAFAGCKTLHQDLVLPNSMKTIGYAAFQNTKITSVNTGGTTSIDGWAFAGCSSLISADLPNVTVVGESGTNYLFANDTALVSVRMPSLVKTSGIQMFMNCTSMREVYMETNDEGITLGAYAFPSNVKVKLFVPEEYLTFYRNKKLGDIPAAMVYPAGEKMGEELVNGFNIGTYIVKDRGDNTYSLITSNIDYSGTLEIPENYNGMAITHIYENAFRNQTFTDVTLKLGNSLKSIGDYAFYQITGLSKIDFGNSIETIGVYAFHGCTDINQDFVLPASMRKIGTSAFYGVGICSLNTGGTTLIESNAFMYCKKLIYVEMPEVTLIAETGNNQVFYGCSSLVSVEMPKLAKAKGTSMFSGCAALREVYMGSDASDLSLGTYVFDSSALTQLKLFVPEDLLSFYQSKKLGDIPAASTYPIGEKVGDLAVNGFVIGDYVVKDHGDGYTLVTSNLSLSGDVFVPNEYMGKPITKIYTNAFRNQTFTDVNLYLGDNMKEIGDGAFYGRTGLKSIVMNQVTTIGTYAFYRTGLQVLNGPKVASLGNQAFSNCSSLEMVNLQVLETVTAEYVFAKCTNLESVYFENVLSLNQYTFYGNLALKKITINKMISSDGSNMPEEMTIEASAPCKIYVPYRTLSSYPSTWSGKPVVSFDITATNNGDTYMLTEKNGRYYLIDYIPANATTSLTIPATVYSAEIGNISIFSIEYGSFTAVTDTLKSLTLPASVAQLGASALGECNALENIYADSASKYFTSVNGVLYSKDAKMLVRFPAGRTGQFDMTASGYASTVGIAAHAFENADELTEIVFPSTLKAIDSTAFIGCSKLQTVEFTGTNPPVLMGAGIFDTTIDEFKMVIPTSSSDVVTAYLCAYNFAEYEPYIDLNGNAAPGSDVDRNKVNFGN